MPNKIVWDIVGERFFETGVDHAVLYPQSAAGAYPKGFAWNGITAVSESPSGAEANPQYADNIKYLNLVSAEEFGCTIEAFTYPQEFAACDGSKEALEGVSLGQQARKQFGLCYRTKLGNDTSGQDLGYKLHLIYGALAAPSEQAHATVNESPEAMSLSWEITTTPISVDGYKPTASMVIDSTKANATKLAALEVILYGVAGEPGTDARMPLPDEIISLMTPASG